MVAGQNRYKVAMVAISLNSNYWPFIFNMMASARKFLLKGHDVDFILWTDMPKDTQIDAKIIPTEPFTWPLPTLHRYHLFLREEELLKTYDYILYCDADMLFVSKVGDEVLGELVAAEHPMYCVKKELVPPYEPNEKSASYIPRPGKVLDENGKKRFKPYYYAGGFQGGRSEVFIEAMKVMKDMVDKDFTDNSYIPIWNDESVWNKYLFEHPPTVVLNPSYIYPDSLNSSYYQKVWGRNYVPKLITLTKPFSLTKDGGGALQTTLKNF
jgi:histo-blood group ABO system transferase